MTTAETVAVMDTRLLNQNERLSRLEITVAKMADGFHPRISDAEEAIGEDKGKIAELHLALGALLDRVAYLEAQNSGAEADRYVELRRIIKVIGLTEILAGWGYKEFGDGPGKIHPDTGEGGWNAACAELHRRYGHIQLDGKPLWSKPPTVSDQTKATIAEALRRRQEA